MIGPGPQRAVELRDYYFCLLLLLLLLLLLFIAINTDHEFDIDIEENVTIKQVQNFKCLGVSLNKKCIDSKHIVNKIFKGRQIISCLNSLWWDKNISLDTKKRLGKAIVESVA